MVWPDRSPHPAMYEFKKLVQPLAFDLKGARRGTLRYYGQRAR